MAFLTIIHIIAALLLITLVLVQDSKGAMGGSFGGGGGATNSILGPTGAPHFLFKLTRYVVVIFALTSLLLSKYTAEKDESALDRVAPTTQSAPVETAPAAAAVPAQTPAATSPAAPAAQ